MVKQRGPANGGPAKAIGATPLGIAERRRRLPLALDYSHRVLAPTFPHRPCDIILSYAMLSYAMLAAKVAAFKLIRAPTVPHPALPPTAPIAGV
jgi:hypothetical protein